MKRYVIIAKSYTHVTEPVGSAKYKGQCAALVQHFGCHQTRHWRKGATVKGNTLIKEGTCVATFEGQTYPNRDHAGVFRGGRLRAHGAGREPRAAGQDL